MRSYESCDSPTLWVCAEWVTAGRGRKRDVENTLADEIVIDHKPRKK